MPSFALQIWNTTRVVTLDEIEQAHRAIGGSGPGRRYATLQINHAYTVLLSSQFQGFCRDLHSEAIDFLSINVMPPSLGSILSAEFRLNRRLDTGNPNPGNIGADFGRFGLAFWRDVYALDRRNNQRRQLLEELNDWRNAIAHQDYTRVGGTTIHLPQVRRWRTSCDGLAQAFDKVMQVELTRLIGTAPWQEKKMPKILPKKLPPKRFHIGDRVRFQWGKYLMEGIVNEEDRPLGKDAAMLVGVRFNPDPENIPPDDAFQTQVYADKLELIEAAVKVLPRSANRKRSPKNGVAVSPEH